MADEKAKFSERVARTFSDLDEIIASSSAVPRPSFSSSSSPPSSSIERERQATMTTLSHVDASPTALSAVGRKDNEGETVAKRDSGRNRGRRVHFAPGTAKGSGRPVRSAEAGQVRRQPRKTPDYVTNPNKYK